MTALPPAGSQSLVRSLPDAWRIEVFARADDHDAAAREELIEHGFEDVERVRRGQGYLLSPLATRAEVERIARELLADPVLESARVYAPRERPTQSRGAARRVLVARKPGVMDPTALTIRRTLASAGLCAAAREPTFDVTTFRIHEWTPRAGAIWATETLRAIATRAIANETIEDVLVDDEALAFARPAPSARRGVVRVPLREVDEAGLARLSRDGALSLSVAEMRAIQAHYRRLEREPTACELETIAQTWSEHCKHKTFTGIVDFDGEVIDNLLKQTIKAATLALAKPWCVSVFHDNAGIIAFDQGFDVCFKVETHNHPSAIDPYGGAGTGVGGVVRDILGVGLGARPIANTDAFFVGPLDLPREDVPKGSLHPRRILRGVIAGVRDYGNRMGIPTISGGVWMHERYVGNPLVYCGTVGILPHGAATKSVAPGDVIVVAGGRTGRDGIHGATFSSAELSEESEIVSSAAVQIGDAIAEKRVLDALMQARDRGLYRSITDCGAGGLSSAVGEMSAECGAEVDLEKAPLKYPGLSPEEIWISEAQERMVLAVPPASLASLFAVFAAEDVEATAIGRFTDTGRLVLRFEGEKVGELDLKFLHGGTPSPVRRATWSPPDCVDPGCPASADHARTLLVLLGHPDVASKEWIVRQYDHEVQGASVVKPLCGARRDGPSDGSVIKPLAGSRKGLALGCGANPRYGLLDPLAMAESVIDEALRNVVAVGGDPQHTALLDNFSWGNCEKPDRLGSLVLAAKGCHRAALAYGTPFISGKDSLNNEYRVGNATISIPPTLLISALSIVPDVARCVTMDLKRAGSRVYLVGRTRPELGGSLYLDARGISGGRVPRPDLAHAPALLRAMHDAIQRGLALAVHDLSEGGLAIAAAEMAFAGDLGLRLRLSEVAVDGLDPRFDPDSTRLYSESASRFLVEVAGADAAEFERALRPVPVAHVGDVVAERELTLVAGHGQTLARIDLDTLARAHRGESPRWMS